MRREEDISGTLLLNEIRETEHRKMQHFGDHTGAPLKAAANTLVKPRFRSRSTLNWHWNWEWCVCLVTISLYWVIWTRNKEYLRSILPLISWNELFKRYILTSRLVDYALNSEENFPISHLLRHMLFLWWLWFIGSQIGDKRSNCEHCFPSMAYKM